MELRATPYLGHHLGICLTDQPQAPDTIAALNGTELLIIEKRAVVVLLQFYMSETALPLFFGPIPLQKQSELFPLRLISAHGNLESLVGFTVNSYLPTMTTIIFTFGPKAFEAVHIIGHN